jgi:lysyl-tRNA synthetase, class II
MLSEQEIIRREALKKLNDLGINPFPSEGFSVNVNTMDILENYPKRKTDYKNISIAGRLMGKRIMGKASFAELQDSKGRIQLYLNRDDLCPGEDKTLYNDVFKKLLDIGDIIGVNGYVFTTGVGEISIHVVELKLLSKSLKPLPVVKQAKNESGETREFDSFSDPEQRYRQRYVDLVVNPQIREVFVKRSQMIQVMRDYLLGKGYLEVETPVLQPLYGGAAAKPFKTHHNTLDSTLYLRIANELYLKRLIVGGYDGVFEFAKDFRNEGMSRFHNPEFTQVEVYVAYKDYEWMMELTENMIEKVAIELHGTSKVQVGENTLDFQTPWTRLSMYEAIEKFTGTDISELDEEALSKVAGDLNIEVDDSMGRGKIIDEIFGEKVEPNLFQPTFITDYPVEMSPLAKKHRTKEGLVERFEAIVNGKELCNAFSELNDPLDQRSRFEEQVKLGKRGDEEAMQLDEDFLRALEYGMPPTAGLGIGIDRLAMVMTNSNSIQDVLFFPQMKPEVQAPKPETLDFDSLGIGNGYEEIFEKLGISSKENLATQKPGKLHNDLCGMRKKLKLEIKNPSPEEVSSWIEKAKA